MRPPAFRPPAPRLPRSRKSAVPAIAILLSVLPVGGAAVPARAEEAVDLAAVHRIKAEAFQNPKVMEHLFFLTDVNGPRLTNSPGYRSAADWAIRSLKEWGVKDARLETWGRFGKGWSLRRFSAHLKEPAYAPIDGLVRAWSGGTNGAVTAPVVHAPLFSAPELERDDDYDIPFYAARVQRFIEAHKGKLRGIIVLIDPARDFPPPAEPLSERYDDTSLAEVARAPEPFLLPGYELPLMTLPEDPEKRERLLELAPMEVTNDYFVRRMRTQDALNAFLRDEGAVAVFAGDRRGHGAIIFGTRGGSYETGAPVPPPIVNLEPETYGRLVRLAERKIPVSIELLVEVAFHDGPESANVIAEIPGGRKRDEVVMLGAHLDSWHAATGATDNAAGCAVTLEAMRILKTLGLRLDRTVRLGLWSGEEQGLFGARGYVRRHFGDPLTMALKPDHARLSAYFNFDNGAGRVRGIYLQGNDMARPLFESWLRPFSDLGATTVAIASTLDTDHEAFDSVGLPGFQFIQDPLDYSTRTHHSSLDVYDHVVPADLMQASAVVASIVYHAANRPDLLPRKPLPRPLPGMVGKEAFRGWE
ncbi:MAG: M20/M25/M40 family metallo-hydrolase [Candidatus Polarisedimenticolia bacterium]